MKNHDVLLKQVGTTTDGKKVFAGVFRFVETHGMPLEVLLGLLSERNIIPCWLAFYREARAAGMSYDRIMSKLDQAVADGLGGPFRDEVLRTFKELRARNLLT